MRRLLSLLPALALLFVLAGCATAPIADDVSAFAPGVVLQDEEVATDEAVGAAKGPSFGDYALVVPQNLVWIPWKILAGTGKGIVDGIAAGFDADRVPLLGLLFSPVNAVMGLLTGLGTGTVSEPGFIGPRTNFSRSMGLPTKRPTPIWWLPD